MVKRLLASAALLVSLLGAPARAADYWVSPTASGGGSGADSLTNAMTPAEAQAAATTAGDRILAKNGTYSWTINPAANGTNASRISIIGNVTAPSAVIVSAVTIDSTSAADAGNYITVKGFTVTGDVTGGNSGYYHARWDTLKTLVVQGSMSLMGGYNFVSDCTVGTGDAGDTFTLAYGGTTNHWASQKGAKRNSITDCTFNLAITGSTNPIIQIRDQDSLYMARCRFPNLLIDAGGVSDHMFTIYGMQNSTIEDCYFSGHTLAGTSSHFPSIRDIYAFNTWARDTIIETSGGNGVCDVAFMTSGDTSIDPEYNGTNTYSNMLVRVRGRIYYQDRCYNDTHKFNVYISQDGGSPWAWADSATIRHNTIVSLGGAIFSADGTMTNLTVKSNIFYGATHIVCNGQIVYQTTAPGVLDSNLVWVKGFPADSAEAFDVGGCASYRPGAGSAWCTTYGNDCASRWGDPVFPDSSDYLNFNPYPPSGSIALASNLWADGYVGALGALVVTTTSLANATTGVPFTRTISASGGTTPYAWAVAGGNIESIVNFNVPVFEETGIIEEGVAYAPATVSIVARVTDAHGDTTSKALAFDVGAASVNGVAGATVLKEAGQYSIGIREIISGDDDSTTVARLFYRRYQGNVAYDSGMVMVRRRGSTIHVGRLLHLQPATTYQFYIENTDASGGLTTTADTCSTRPVPALRAQGNVYYVSKSGADANPGTAASPKLTIGNALSTLSAAGSAGYGGGVILVGPGEWHEKNAINFADGTENPKGYFITGNNPALRDSIIIDGSEERAANENKNHDGTTITWASLGATADADSIYYTLYQGADSCTQVTLNYGERLHKKTTLAELMNNTGGQIAGFYCGASVDGNEGNDTLYVKRGDGTSPTGTILHAGYYDNLLWLQKKRIRVSNIHFRFAGGVAAQGYGVRVGAGASFPAAGSSVDSCRFTGMGLGSVIGTGGQDSISVRNCVFDGLGVGNWSYQAAKTRAEEGTIAISFTGKACTAWGNTIDGMSNAIVVYSGSATDSTMGADNEIIGNTIRSNSDDAIEADLIHGINLLIMSNTVWYSNTLLSMAPLWTGPAWVLRNAIRSPRGYIGAGFKYGTAGAISGDGYVLTAHNTVYQGSGAGSPVYITGRCKQKVFRNNIFKGGGSTRYTIRNLNTAAPDSAGTFTNDFNYNVVDTLSGTVRMAHWGNVAYSPANWRANGAGFVYEANGAFGNAAVTDSATGNLAPTAGSAAVNVGQRIPGINTGLFVTSGVQYSGAAPDAGAQEFVPVTWRRRSWLRTFIHIFF